MKITDHPSFTDTTGAPAERVLKAVIDNPPMAFIIKSLLSRTLVLGPWIEVGSNRWTRHSFTGKPFVGLTREVTRHGRGDLWDINIFGLAQGLVYENDRLAVLTGVDDYIEAQIEAIGGHAVLLVDDFRGLPQSPDFTIRWQSESTTTEWASAVRSPPEITTPHKQNPTGTTTDLDRIFDKLA